MTLCVCVCVFMREWGLQYNILCTGRIFLKTIVIHIRLYTETRHCATYYDIFSFILLKNPLSIDFMTHLRGMICNLKNNVLKDIEQNSIQYWSLYVMEKRFMNFFF